MALATAGDVRTRLGRDLTDAETAQATGLIDSVGNLVADAAGITLDALNALNPVPPGLKVVCVEAVVRVILNPAGVSSASETLGQHSRARSYRGMSGALELTDDERLRLRKAIHGSTVANARADSIADEIADAAMPLGYPPFPPVDETEQWP